MTDIEQNENATNGEKPAAYPCRVEPLVMRSSRCSVTLYLADCHDLLPIEADAVVSDPPYGIEWDGNAKRFTSGHDVDRTNHGVILHDDQPFDPEPWLSYKRVVLWGYPYFAARVPIGTTLVWDKRFENGAAFLADAEIAWCKSQYPKPGPHMGGYGTYIVAKTWQGFVRSEPVMHPTQKPVMVMEWCIEKAKVPDGATVLDPFMGSGTTGIACIRRGLNFIGVEKDERYFGIAVERLRRELAQGRMF